MKIENKKTQRNGFPMRKISTLAGNEDGYVIIAAIMVLALLTLIGISATNISTTERQISTNSLLYERAFYTAESGLEHFRELLKVQFIKWNTVKLATGTAPDCDFALNGAVTGVPALDTSFPGGSRWIDTTIDGVNYKVTVWNNADGGGATDDTDGLIFARSVATGPRGETCSVEQLLAGDADGESITGYTAQQGAGSGKSYVSNDADAITDFSDQL